MGDDRAEIAKVFSARPTSDPLTIGDGDRDQVLDASSASNGSTGDGDRLTDPGRKELSEEMA